MTRRFLLLGLVGLLGAVFGGSAAAVAASWGGAVGLSGSATLNSSGDAGVNSVSCAAAGECAAGGYYRDGSSHEQAFVVSETSGSWGNPVEVPGTATLNSGGVAEVNSVSCAAAGECAAGGSYRDGSGHFQVFVVSETNGRWGNAVKVPGTATLNSGGVAAVYSVSCAAVGECAVGGSYEDGSGNYQAFVASETNGRWGNAVKVPGTATLNSGGAAGVYSVSCAAAGDCAAGGSYEDGSSHAQAFVVSETSGSWGDAVEVPGTAALNSDGIAGADSVSCAAAGDCAAGGYYKDGSSHAQAFVVSETSGSWGDAVEVPGTAALNSSGDAGVYSVSCAAVGDCAVGGYYKDGSSHAQAFVVSETSGSWGDAVEVPGTAALNSGGDAGADSVSCAGAGDCTIGGYYQDGSSNYQAFVVSETSGSWGDAVEVPGTATLNSGGYAQVDSVSCGAAGDCAAGGSYQDGSGIDRAFVVNETSGSWGNAIQVRNFPASCVVPNVVGKALRAAKKKLKASHCGLGKIKTVYSKVKKGRVVAQRPKPGKHLNDGGKVALTVSKGKKK